MKNSKFFNNLLLSSDPLKSVMRKMSNAWFLTHRCECEKGKEMIDSLKRLINFLNNHNEKIGLSLLREYINGFNQNKLEEFIHVNHLQIYPQVLAKWRNELN